MKNTISPKMTRLLFLVLTLGLGLLSLNAMGQATVTTDKLDYIPGEYVIITGAGWQPGETVTLHIAEDPKPATCILPHDMTAVADANGNIYNDQMLIKENHLGVAFVLTATGQSSGLTATTTFTDGAYLFAAQGLPSNTSVSVDYNITGNGGGNCNSCTPIPTFIPPATAGGSINNKTITVNSYSTTFNPNPPSGNINYVILNYGLRIGAINQPTNIQTSNSFSVGGGSGGNAALFTANYGALVSSDKLATYGSSVTLTSTFYLNYQTSAGISGKTITFYIDGTSVGAASTNASGVASLNIDLTNVPSLGKLDAGDYELSASFVGDSGFLPVSRPNSTFGTLTVGQRAITITADAGQSKTYGDADPTLTATVTSGTIVGGDVASGSLVRASGENVGLYAISQGTYTYGSNYDETYVGADFEITQRAITITADAGQSKTYGDADPTLTATVTSGTI
ncbi:MBG domain-containing protein, partial [Algoriphagus aestuariicola]